ncbi:hypothetical protein CN095_29220 [Sinorhizobium meliloti]|nr:hypothetical protein CN216_21960 [Sinorhizobium meliloti]RVK43725.1 hypothetical protein CN162_34340 [Sinorhizobium meliloti]RVM77441.1 hypothetical protein CN122_34500 [Sinorhizobium meliloti]RVN63193.1 hypothetical protein CN110_33140 [Sinorhizobium meliloti]RVO26888.1 hypothetical protein CN095_29220 [Sinorhizobium meliloti]
MSRAIRRDLTNMKIQAYLTATAVNLKRLAGAFSCHFAARVPPRNCEVGSISPQRRKGLCV